MAARVTSARHCREAELAMAQRGDGTPMSSEFQNTSSGQDQRVHALLLRGEEGGGGGGGGGGTAGLGAAALRAWSQEEGSINSLFYCYFFQNVKGRLGFL